MPRITLKLTSDSPAAPALALRTASVQTALAVTDIMVERGSAELFVEGRRLARVRKHGGDHATFWEVG